VSSPSDVAVAPTPAPATSTPSLVVLRGNKAGARYPIYEGKNYIGRTDEEPVDINLEDQERDTVWSSRQHCCITLENGVMTLEDLKSANGTYVNRNRVVPGAPVTLKANDIIQVGPIQMRVEA
jgi:pSer/pThr/pTyr-binding forkhead associated (FHA) protein